MAPQTHQSSVPKWMPALSLSWTPLKRIGCSLRTNLTRGSDEKEQKLGQSHSVDPDALVRVTPSCFCSGWAGDGPTIEALEPTVHILFATK